MDKKDDGSTLWRLSGFGPPPKKRCFDRRRFSKGDFFFFFSNHRKVEHIHILIFYTIIDLLLVTRKSSYLSSIAVFQSMDHEVIHI